LREYRLTTYYDGDTTVVNYETCKNLDKARELARGELAFSEDAVKVRIEDRWKGRKDRKTIYVTRGEDFDKDAALAALGWVKTTPAPAAAGRRQ